jgi:hypothetical protein
MFVAGFIGSLQMDFIERTLEVNGAWYYAVLGGDRLYIDSRGFAKSPDRFKGRSVCPGIRRRYKQ